jgi:hypothetical protein
MTSLYRVFDVDGDLLYVGISRSVLRRIAGHSEGSPWWREVASIQVRHLADRSTAAAAEKDAIVNERPRYNIVHRGADLVRTAAGTTTSSTGGGRPVHHCEYERVDGDVKMALADAMKLMSEIPGWTEEQWGKWIDEGLEVWTRPRDGRRFVSYAKAARLRPPHLDRPRRRRAA